MSDFFADLRQDLDRSARRRARIRRARPVVTAMAVAAIAVVVATSVASIDLSRDNEIALPAPVPVGECKSDRPPPEIAEKFSVFRIPEVEWDRPPDKIVARISGALPGGAMAQVWPEHARLARESSHHTFWLIPAIAGTCEDPKPAVCVVYEEAKLTLPGCYEVAKIKRGISITSGRLSDDQWFIAGLVPDSTGIEEVEVEATEEEAETSIEGNIFEARYNATQEESEWVKLDFTPDPVEGATIGSKPKDCGPNVTVTHEPPSKYTLEVLPMFTEPNMRWTRERAVEVFGAEGMVPYKSGAHIDYIRDLGVHGGWHLQAVPINDMNLTQPAPHCAPEYDPSKEKPGAKSGVVCIVFWRPEAEARSRSYVCTDVWSVVSHDHYGLSMSQYCIGPEVHEEGRPPYECRLLWAILPAGARDAVLVPTNKKGDPKGSPVPLSPVGQVHVAEVDRLKGYKLRFVDAEGKTRSTDDERDQGG